MIFAKIPTIPDTLKMNTGKPTYLTDMCRVCMMTSEYLKEVICYKLSQNIVNMLNKIADIDASLNDCLPTFICNTCYNRLRDSYMFKKLCIDSNNTLRSYILKMQENSLKELSNNNTDDVKINCSETPSLKRKYNEIETTPNIESKWLKSDLKYDISSKIKIEDPLINNDCFIIETPPIRTYNVDENKFEDSATPIKLNENFNTNVEIEIIDVESFEIKPEKVDVKCVTPIFEAYNYAEPSPDYLNALGLVKIQHSTDDKKHVKKEFKCKICSATLLDYGAYRRHLSTHGELPFPCKICDKRFKDARKLKHHMSNTHSGMRPYSCSQCEAKFRTLDELASHRRRHTGTVDAHVCAQCPRRFASAKHLREHSSSHELDPRKSFKRHPNGFGDHACALCDRKFRKRCDLERHERVHSGEKPYECMICGGRFQQAHNLTKHMVTHTGMRSYTCDICHKTFGRSDVLARHMHVHEVSKPHCCKICSRTFARHSQLVTHMDKRHSNTETKTNNS